MWTFRATYDVPEYGIRKGDGLDVYEDRVTILARRFPPSVLPPLTRHLLRFRCLRGHGLNELLRLSPEDSDGPSRHHLRLLR